MTLQRLFADWRATYVADSDAQNTPPPGHGSIFERLLHSGEPDEATHILWRGEHCFAILNAYPYGSGHLMVLPNEAIGRLADLSPVQATELWAGIQDAVAAVEAAYAPDGVNVGMNMGRGAGAGIPDHLHFHVLPRWLGDTNFMTSIGETRVLPESLDRSWKKLSAAWPRSPRQR